MLTPSPAQRAIHFISGEIGGLTSAIEYALAKLAKKAKVIVILRKMCISFLVNGGATLHNNKNSVNHVIKLT